MISWQNRPLADFVTSRPGNNKIIKGKQSSQPGHGLFQGFSASGPDVWVNFADYHQPGVVISAVGARCGKTFPADGDWTAIANTHVLLPGNDIHPRWLWYRTNDEDFWIKGGAAQPFVKVKDTLQQAIPIPPLLEQRRIVRVLDEAFEGLAIAKANAEKNLQNARALFESHLQSVFTHRGPGWVEKRLGDVVTRLTNGYVGPTRNIYQESGVPYLLARHVKNNRLLFDYKTFISDDFNRKNKKSRLKAGDVLLVQSGHIGHSAVVTEEHEGHNCHAMIVITAAEGAFIGPFLSLFFSSSEMKQKFQQIRSGSTVPHLTCGEVKELMIPLPDRATQTRVVDHSKELDAETQRLTRIYEQKLAALDALKKSLLYQAFSGNL